MVQTIAAKEVTLRQLRTQFSLEPSTDPQFFKEWQDHLPELNDREKQLLDEVQSDYLYLSESQMLEPIVKMVVLSPLLRLAGFYRPPFELTAEKEVKITSEDEGTVITGRIDVLVFQPEFWVAVIEAKQAAYSLETAVPQALAYVLGNLNAAKPVFGFATNGGTFQFLKLTKQGVPKYARSDVFSIYDSRSFYTVVRVLKQMALLVSQGNGQGNDTVF
ncbi:MAG: restriction endonuclease subunit R [Cyanothece sp. SIO1E1]|nr:restriction endonuclease subunit R [Cyanothece sp. SIO1E1]